MKVLCSEGCNICFHYPACWHAFEGAHKAEHPEFSFKARTLIIPVIPMQGLLDMLANAEVTCSDMSENILTEQQACWRLSGWLCVCYADAMRLISLQRDHGRTGRHLPKQRNRAALVGAFSG